MSDIQNSLAKTCSRLAVCTGNFTTFTKLPPLFAFLLTYLKRREFEAPISGRIGREFLPDGLHDTRWQHDTNLLADVPPAPPNEIPICCVSVAPVEINTHLVKLGNIKC
jgi:hypothetical protein